MSHTKWPRAIGISLIIFTTQANAEPYYAGFALGWSSADEECGDYYNCDGTDSSLKVFGGSRIHENIALEASYQDLGHLNDKTDLTTSTADSSGLNLSVLGIIPISETFELFGKVGYMSWDTKYRRIGLINDTIHDSGTDFTFGGGLSWILDEEYVLRFEFERLNELGDEFTAGGTHITLWSFGGAILF